MKKLLVLTLSLVMLVTMAACGCKHEFTAADCLNPATCTLCGEIEGTANGHVMVEASCEKPRHCENCDLTEGEALGHSWLEATTEMPKHCENCDATEGERIITDPRFTTAATKDLYGTWTGEIPVTEELCGIPGFPEGATLKVGLCFYNDGKIQFTGELTDSFLEATKQYSIDQIYAELADMGLSKESVDDLIESEYGMSTAEYVAQQLDNMDMQAMFESTLDALNIEGVYYVEGDLLYTGDSWEYDLSGDAFSLNGDILTISGIFFGDDVVFTRVTE